MVIPELQFYGTAGAMQVVQSYLDKWNAKPITFSNDVSPGNDSTNKELHEATWHVVSEYFGNTRCCCYQVRQREQHTE